MDDYVKSLPDDWRHDRLKDVASLCSEKTDEKSSVKDYLELEDIESWSMRILNWRNTEEVESAVTKFEKGDVLFGKLRPYLAKVCRPDKSGKCTGEILAIHPTHIDGGYLRYALIDPEMIKKCTLFSYGAKMPRVNWATQLSTFEIPIPPCPEQERIAAFLDEKCAAVDKAIEVKRKQLESVDGLWTNVLQEMTVRGVRKTRLVQTDNVFIPEIPEGWKLAKTLHCLDMPITDGPHTTPELWDEGVPFVSAEAVANGMGKIDFTRIRGYISEEFYEECCKKYIPRRDDVYMVKSGATTGRVAIVDTDTRFTIWSPLAVFRARSYRILPRYLFYTIQARYYQEQVERNWTFGTQQNIGMRALERLKIILPPLTMQAEIVNSLDERRAHLDDVANNLRKQIETLELYRKSLIHEYVTGERRVG